MKIYVRVTRWGFYLFTLKPGALPVASGEGKLYLGADGVLHADCTEHYILSMEEAFTRANKFGYVVEACFL